MMNWLNDYVDNLNIMMYWCDREYEHINKRKIEPTRLSEYKQSFRLKAFRRVLYPSKVGCNLIRLTQIAKTPKGRAAQQ